MGKYFSGPGLIGGVWVAILFTMMLTWDMNNWLALLIGVVLGVATSVIFNLGPATDEEPWALEAYEREEKEAAARA